MSPAVETMLPDAPSEGANGAVTSPNAGCHGRSGWRPSWGSARRLRPAAAMCATDDRMPSGPSTRRLTSSGNGTPPAASSANPSAS